MFLTPVLPIVYCLVFALGAVLGSYLLAWIHRYQARRYNPLERSRCLSCGRQLAWYENIPVVSWLALRGRCRTCRATIPVYYFLIELVTGLLFVLTTYYHLRLPVFSEWHYLRDLFFVSLLVVIFTYDALYLTVISSLVWFGGVIGLVINIFILRYSWMTVVWGAVVGGGFFLAQYVVSRGRWVGGGDVRLGVMLGAWLGFPVVLVALMTAYLLGASFAIPLLASRKKGWQSEIPFGTFLSVGTGFALFYGADVIAWYRTLFSLL